MMLLVSSAWAVIKVVERSKGIEDIPDASWLRQNEITLAMSLITTVFPNLFEVIGMLEKYHPRKQLRWQLGRYVVKLDDRKWRLLSFFFLIWTFRIMVLNFLNLYTLMFALFGKVTTMVS